MHYTIKDKTYSEKPEKCKKKIFKIIVVQFLENYLVSLMNDLPILLTNFF